MQKKKWSQNKNEPKHKNISYKGAGLNDNNGGSAATT